MQIELMWLVAVVLVFAYCGGRMYEEWRIARKRAQRTGSAFIPSYRLAQLQAKEHNQKRGDA